MFILAPTETFEAPVKVSVATPSGTWREESFTGIFKRTHEAEREDLMRLTNVELLRRVMTGWKMEDEQRVPVPFTPENFDAFLQLIGAVRETMLVYWARNAGAKEKN